MYQNIATTYAEKHKHIPDFWIMCLAAFTQVVPLGSHILDVGCGHGRDAYCLTQQGFKVVGIDVSKYMLDEARKLCGGLVVLRHMNMDSLMFPDQLFSGLWVSASFLHIPKEHSQEVLRGFRRVLISGGYLMLILKEGTGERYVEDGRFFSYYTQHELQTLLQAEGLTEVARYKSEDGWIASLSRKV